MQALLASSAFYVEKESTKDTKAYPGLQNMLLYLVAPPAALDPDGRTLGLQKLHPGRKGSEGCLQLHHVLTVLQIGPALACSSVDGLHPGHQSFNSCSIPAYVLVLLMLSTAEAFEAAHFEHKTRACNRTAA